MAIDMFVLFSRLDIASDIDKLAPDAAMFYLNDWFLWALNISHIISFLISYKFARSSDKDRFSLTFYFLRKLYTSCNIDKYVKDKK